MAHTSLVKHSTTIPSPLRGTIRRTLLRWYDRNKRDLPWRRCSGDPYAQWVAEIMLQQTRVETVIAYYERFLRRFPTVDALAKADHEEVLKHWEGLGYYRRALQLHRAARRVSDQGEGIPNAAEALRRLPGIGEYTAAAIASIAFDRREAAVDGNVGRVVARLFGVSKDILSSTGRARVRELAAQLMPLERPGDFNQAWMDLGSMVCTPKSPKCTVCPLSSVCAATATGRSETLPVRDGHRKVTEVSIVVGIFIHIHKRCILARRRPTGGLWSGLWEFPNVEVPESSAKTKRAAGFSPRRSSHVAAIQRLAETEGLSILPPVQQGATVRHRLTHRSLTFHVYVSRVDPVRSVPQDAPRRWVTLRGFGRLSVSTAHRRIFAAAQTPVGQVLR